MVVPVFRRSPEGRINVAGNVVITVRITQCNGRQITKHALVDAEAVGIRLVVAFIAVAVARRHGGVGMQVIYAAGPLRALLVIRAALGQYVDRCATDTVGIVIYRSGKTLVVPLADQVRRTGDFHSTTIIGMVECICAVFRQYAGQRCGAGKDQCKQYPCEG